MTWLCFSCTLAERACAKMLLGCIDGRGRLGENGEADQEDVQSTLERINARC